MRPLAHGASIRQYLLLLVLAVMLPFIALHTYIVSRHVRRDTDDTNQTVERYAALATTDSAHFIDDIHATMVRLSGDTVVHHTTDGCSGALQSAAHADPNFTNISIMSVPQGTLLCSSVPAARGRAAHIAPVGFAASLAHTNALLASPAFFDAIHRRWLVAFGYPFPTPDGRNALVITVDLLAGAGVHYRTALVGESLPPGSTTTIVDGRSRVLGRWPNANRWVGHLATKTPIIDYLHQAKGPGHIVTRGLDGKQRLYGFAPVAGTAWRVYVGIPTDIAIAPARRFMWRDTALGVFAGILALVLAGVVGGYIARPVRRLADAARAAIRDDLNVRAPMQGPGEVRGAADAFNELLQERQRAEAALAEEKRKAEITLTSIGDAVVRIDSTARITYLNPAAEHLTGWSFREAEGQPLFNVVKLLNEATREQVCKTLDRVLQDRAVVDVSANTRLVARDGKEYDVADSAAPLLDPDKGTVGAVLVFRDITETQELERRLSWQARHDSLTGLVNRVEFESQVVEAIDEAKHQGAKHFLMYVDLDQFKNVNDTAGHLAGDELLRRLAETLKVVLGPPHTVARVGGDEFCVLLRNASIAGAEAIAEQIRRDIQDFHFLWDGHAFGVGASIGLVALEPLAGGLEDVMNAADIACYAAKEQGRNRVHVFVPEDEAVRERLEEPEWVRRITRALDEHRFRLFEQAIVPIAAQSDDPVMHEVLVRMCDERGNLLPPTAFLPAANRYNLLTMLDRWVVSNALSCIGRGKSTAPYHINLSGHSISDDRFLQFVLNQFEVSGIDPHQICFEITESAAVVNLNRAMRFMQELRSLGAHFALDDFGVGISSLSYLRTLPVDVIKIDGRFVRNIDRDHIDHAMVEAIIRVGRVIGVKTVAESVENERTRTYLQALGADYAQGYGVSHPQPIEYVLGNQVAPECRPA